MDIRYITDSKSQLAQNGSRNDLEPYVPTDHRPQKSNTSSVGALAHLLKASLSSGMLAMPLAFKDAGLVVGCIGTIVVGFICTHAVHILVHTSQDLCIEVKKPCLNYSETCDLAFQYGPNSTKKFSALARELADWSLALTHLGACCVYVVIIAESFKQLSDEFDGPDWSLSIFCALTLVVIGPLTQITKLKYLVPFSALANIVWFITICISLYYCLRHPQDVGERNMWTTIHGIPSFISTCLFAMEGIGVVMPLENEMAKPQHFIGCPGVLNIAMSIVVLLYGFVGFIGYLSFGEAVRGNLILNLPQDETLALVAKVLVACVMILTHALIYYVPVDVIWRRLERKVRPDCRSWTLAGLRLFGALLTVYLLKWDPVVNSLARLALLYCQPPFYKNAYLPTFGAILIPTLVYLLKWDPVVNSLARLALLYCQPPFYKNAYLPTFGAILIPTLVGVACAVPKLELFMQLVGALCLSIVGLFLPATVETVWRWNRGLGPCNWILWKNAVIVLFSIIALFSGATYAIMSIVDDFTT